MSAIQSHLYAETLDRSKMLDEEQYQRDGKEQKEIVVAAMKFAEESPWPDPITLEEDVFALRMINEICECKLLKCEKRSGKRSMKR